MYNDDLVLETERLVLRPFAKEDIPRVFELLHGNEALVEYLPFDTPKEIGDTVGFFESIGDDAQVFALIDKNTGVLMGLGGINNIVANHKGSIGYWIHQDYQGKGFVTETGKILLDWGLEEGNLKVVYGHTFGPNKASQKVLIKCGFKYVGEVPFGEMKNGKYYNQTLWYKIKENE